MEPMAKRGASNGLFNVLGVKRSSPTSWRQRCLHKFMVRHHGSPGGSRLQRYTNLEDSMLLSCSQPAETNNFSATRSFSLSPTEALLINSFPYKLMGVIQLRNQKPTSTDKKQKIIHNLRMLIRRYYKDNILLAEGDQSTMEFPATSSKSYGSGHYPNLNLKRPVV